jgi:hypothetical protein
MKRGHARQSSSKVRHAGRRRLGAAVGTVHNGREEARKLFELAYKFADAALGEQTAAHTNTTSAWAPTRSVKTVRHLSPSSLALIHILHAHAACTGCMGSSTGRCMCV